LFTHLHSAAPKPQAREGFLDSISRLQHQRGSPLMKRERAMDRHNRRWGSLRYAVPLRVRVSGRAKAILSALRNCEDERISYGAVIEKLVEQHANLLGQNDGD
jgi:hypothetical protein